MEIESVDLVKGISRLALALEDESVAIGRKIAFTAAPAFQDQLPCIRKEPRLLRGIIRGACQRPTDNGKEKGQKFSHRLSDHSRCLEQKRFIQQARLDRDHNKQAMSNAAAFLFCAELFRALNLMIVILSGGKSLH